MTDRYVVAIGLGIVTTLNRGRLGLEWLCMRNLDSALRIAAHDPHQGPG